MHALPQDEREAAYHESRAHYRQTIPDGTEPDGLVLLGHYRQMETLGFEFAFEQGGEAGDRLRLFAEEQGEVEPVADMLQAFLQRFRPTQEVALTWACTCSRPRPDTFSGGGVVIGGDRQEWFDATRWVQQHLEGSTSRECRAQLTSIRSAAFASIKRYLRSQPERQIDLDEAGEAVDLGEPAEHAPYIITIGLGENDTSLWATVYQPIDVNEESWDATELDHQLTAEDAVHLLQAIERAMSPDAP